MSGFSPEWLTLREPADHRARDPMLALKVADRLQKLPRITVTDLGCGTGSNIRATYALLGSEQHWTLVDYDPKLLAAARELLSAWAERATAIGDTLELIKSGHIVAIQDMGAAGLTSSSAEMAARGDVGVTIDTSKCPVRETGMTPYEILLSESQERMLVVAIKGHEQQVKAILEKWDLTAEVIGEVIAEPVYRVTEGDHVVAEFPGSKLVTECPVYYPDAKESTEIQALRARDPHGVAPRPEEADPAWTLRELLSSPTIASKTWVYRQYDSTVRASTIVGPGPADAAVVRIPGTDKAIAVKTDCNGRYVYLEPRTGGRIAVAEAARNVACTGATPKAITNLSLIHISEPTRPY